MNPGGPGIGREHQVRKSQILNDLRALAARCELLLGEVDSDDPNGGTDHGGGGGERDLLSEYLVESRHLLGGVVTVHGDQLEEAIRLVTAHELAIEVAQPQGVADQPGLVRHRGLLHA